MIDKERIQERFNELVAILRNWQNDDGYWEGELSSSALGVAVACAALHFDDQDGNRPLIEKGMKWLAKNKNRDGGFGDTPESQSNMSTSLLCYSSVYLNQAYHKESRSLLRSVSDYLAEERIDVKDNKVSTAILAHYKTDRTFSVPILTMCALCGVPGGRAFEKIPSLPFELALLPRSFYRMLNMSVVSYAIPALIAVGIAIFKHKREKNVLLKVLRQASIKKSLLLLEKMMPASGGFLEAIPLTAFVSLCLTRSGYNDSPVVRKGIAFLRRTQREDGSWPIDIDLSTWVSSLSIKSLRGNLRPALDEKSIEKLIVYYRSVQNKEKHSFNASSPGGWGWTKHTGSVPDGDDTPAAILAMLELSAENPLQYKNEIENACNWLLQLKNRDGGFPTFVKGWGKLPFDRSCADLTGHAVLALSKSIELLSPEKASAYKRAVKNGINYLVNSQQEDGSLLPLWFGNQMVNDHSNPVYGTARVITYLRDAKECNWINEDFADTISEIIKKGIQFLFSVQNSDGSWGGGKGVPGTMEETSLALSAVMYDAEESKIKKALDWLDEEFRSNGLKANPIGLYFASLWYHEKMYPLTAYLEVINRRMERD